MTICYFANDSIKIIEGAAKGGKVAVNRVCQMKPPEGTYINGMVVDEDLFLPFLKEFWTENHFEMKNVQLVISSTQFVTKRMLTPVMKKKKMQEYIPREFTDAEEKKNPIYGYFKLEQLKDTQDKKNIPMQYIFATMVEKEFVDFNVKMFQTLGIEIAEVRTAIGGVIRTLKLLPDLKNKTSITMTIDGSYVMTALFVNGSYTYSEGRRIFAEPGTEAMGAELVNSVNNVLQFVKSQQIDATVNQVYLVGVGAANYAYCEEYIPTLMVEGDQKIQVSHLSGNGLVTFANNQELYETSLAIYAIGAMLNKTDESGLMEQYLRDPEKEAELAQKRRARRPIVLAAGIAAIVILAELGFLTAQHTRLNSLNDYNTSSAVTPAVTQYDALEAQDIVWQNQYQYLDNMQKKSLSYPVMTSAIESVFTGCAQDLANVTINSFDAASGIVSVDARSVNVDNINSFIAKLKQQDTFGNVSYSGYVFDETEGMWTINVTCTLAEAAGREDAR